jgi:PAS domain-containing protein
MNRTLEQNSVRNSATKNLQDEANQLHSGQSSTIHDLQYIISKMPGYIYWKNKHSEYMGCNEQLAKFSQLRTPADIVGKTDYDFAWGKEQADQFVQDDQRVMKTGESLVTEHELPEKREDGKNLYVRTYDRKSRLDLAIQDHFLI